MTKVEEKDARAALDIAVLVWGGRLDFDSGVWFIEQNCPYRDRKAEDILARLMAALAAKDLEKMLQRAGDKNVEY